MIPATARRLLALLPPAQRRSAYWLLPAMILMAVMETVGVATVMPFLAVVANPTDAIGNRYLGAVYHALGFTGTTSFLLFLGAASLAVLVLSNGFAVFVTYLLNRFALRQNHLWQTRLMAAYLGRPYAAFLRADTAELGKNILVEVSEVVSKVLTPMLQLMARFAAAVSVIALLVVVDPVLALTVSAALGSAYALVFLVVRRTLQRLGAERLAVDAVRFRAISEAFGGVKDVKVAGRERTYVDRFRAASERFSALTVTQRVINVVPKYGLEVIAFGGIIMIVLQLLATNHSTATVLPLIGLYAFASYRLMPAVQQMFEAITQLRFSLPSLGVLERDLAVSSATDLGRSEPTGLREAIELRDVWYAYPGSPPNLTGIDLTIPKNSSVAFVGTTGSGKTTLVDLILGLLTPSGGAVLVDGVPLDAANVRGWQASVGYVSQQAFLCNGTVAENIAFGVPGEEVDEAALHRAAAAAQLDRFVARLPDGYLTQVGERGLRLSGGQRQRLAIARALYHDPPVVVFDEATSALDNVTERAVLDALEAMAGRRTVLIVAHRLSTVRGCDLICLVEGGTIVARGAYDDLLATSPEFRALVQPPRAARRGPEGEPVGSA